MAIVNFQGLWNNEANSQAGYSMLVGKNPRRNNIRRAMNREGFRQITALFNALVGAATGGAVNVTHKRIAQPSSSSGSGIPDLGHYGLRTIDVVTDINRNTAAADVTKLKEMTVGVKVRPSPMPKDLSGNGGPSF